MENSLLIFTVFGILITFFTGTVFGSFINCLSWRIVNGENVMKGRSHCTACNHALGPKDLFPVFSYIFLKGKCRYCGKKISPRYMIVELVSGTAFLFSFIKFRFSWNFIFSLVLICILIGLSLVDLDSYEIPNGFIIAGIVNWVVSLPLVSGLIGPKEMVYINNGETSIALFKGLLKNGLISGFVISASLLFLSWIFDKVTGKESLGGGDIKLFFMIGLYMTLTESLLCLIIACIIGIFFAVTMKKEKIPFGPSISVAAFITLLTGSFVTNWYLNLLS